MISLRLFLTVLTIIGYLVEVNCFQHKLSKTQQHTVSTIASVSPISSKVSPYTSISSRLERKILTLLEEFFFRFSAHNGSKTSVHYYFRR